MATLTIRSLPDAVHRLLRIRAAEKGRSMEAEARAILETSLVEGGRRAAWLAAGAEIREALRSANGGQMPSGMVDRFLSEKRRNAAAEFAKLEAYSKAEMENGQS